MNNSGVFAVHRGIFGHPIFAPEPFTEREAWLWLISAAAWKPVRIRLPHGMTSVGRGEVIHSQRFLASKWKWDRSRVRRFLSMLESEAMITQQKAHETTRITICNYNKYAFDGPAHKTSENDENSPATTQQRPKEEESNNLINKNSMGEDAEKIVPIRRYAFEGRIIRLDQPGLDRWQKTYHAIPDIMAALQLADDYYSENPPKDNKWFFPVSKWLQREHDQHCEKTRTANSRPDRSW